MMCRRLVFLVSFVLVFGVVLVSVSSAVNPTYRFKMNETEGYIAGDSSGSDNDGEFISNSDPNWVTSGRFGGAMSFGEDAHEDQVEIPTNYGVASLPGMEPNEGTITMWIYRTRDALSEKGDCFIFGTRDADGNRIQLYLGTNHWLCLGFGDNHLKYTDLCFIALDTWYHVALVWKETAPSGSGSGKYWLYVGDSGGGCGDYDDVKTVSAGNYTGLSDLSSTANIANNGDSTRSDRIEGFRGRIDEVGIWDCNILAEDVNQVYMNGVPQPTFSWATEPSPCRGDYDVSLTKVLSWTPGTGDPCHDVYLGTDFNDVNEAERNDRRGVLVSIRQAASSYTPSPALAIGAKCSWRIDEINPGPNTVRDRGKTWRFTADDGCASNPEPDDDDDPDSSDRVSTDVLLKWKPGSFVKGTGGHDVYLDIGGLAPNEPDVNTSTYTTGNAYVGTVDVNEYRCSNLILGRLYWWRIDQNNVSLLPTSKGDTWAFETVFDFLIDDFNDYDGSSVELRKEWDEIPNESKTDLYLKTDEFYEGGESMKMKFCDDDVPGTSGALKNVPKDWILGGNLAAFGLWYNFVDPATNQATGLSVTVASGNPPTQAATATADGNDPNIDGEWHQWNVDYREFEASNPLIDLNDIDSVTISVTATGEDYVYFDYIALYAPRFVLTERQADGDVRQRGDGWVDAYDVERLVDDWLEIDTNSIGWDGILENFADSTSHWVSGKYNNSLQLQTLPEDEYDAGEPWVCDYVELDDYCFPNFCDVTMCVWVKKEGIQRARWASMVFGTHSDYRFNIGITSQGGYINMPRFRAGEERDNPDGTTDKGVRFKIMTAFNDDQWYHLAFEVSDRDNDGYILGKGYLDGVLRATCDWDYLTARPVEKHESPDLRGACIGAYNNGQRDFFGGELDEFRIYKDAVGDVSTGLNYEDPNIGAIRDGGGTTGVGDANLIVWYKFDESTGLVANDSGRDYNVDVYHMLRTPANLEDEQRKFSKSIDLKDYAVMAKDWLVQELWPSPDTKKNCLYKVTDVNNVGGFDKCPRFLGDQCHTSGTCVNFSDCTTVEFERWYGDDAKTKGCCVTFSRLDCTARKARMCPDPNACP